MNPRRVPEQLRLVFVVVLAGAALAVLYLAAFVISMGGCLAIGPSPSYYPGLMIMGAGFAIAGATALVRGVLLFKAGSRPMANGFLLLGGFLLANSALRLYLVIGSHYVCGIPP